MNQLMPLFGDISSEREFITGTLSNALTTINSVIKVITKSLIRFAMIELICFKKCYNIINRSYQGFSLIHQSKGSVPDNIYFLMRKTPCGAN